MFLLRVYLRLLRVITGSYRLCYNLRKHFDISHDLGVESRQQSRSKLNTRAKTEIYMVGIDRITADQDVKLRVTIRENYYGFGPPFAPVSRDLMFAGAVVSLATNLC